MAGTAAGPDSPPFKMLARESIAGRPFASEARGIFGIDRRAGAECWSRKNESAPAWQASLERELHLARSRLRVQLETGKVIGART